MDPDIEQRIRDVYPTGRLREIRRASLLDDDLRERVEGFCEFMHTVTRFQFAWNIEWNRSRTFHISFTMPAPDAPQFDEWVWAFENAERMSWIDQHGEPFSVLHLHVSRVWPAYRFYYNIWRQRGETGYVDIEVVDQPLNPAWNIFSRVAFPALEEIGIHKLDDDALREEICFVLEEDWGENEDEADWDDDREPELVATNLLQCLFQEH